MLRIYQPKLKQKKRKQRGEKMSDIGKLATGVVLFSAQLVAVGALLAVGFRLGDKLMNKFSRKSK